MDQINLKSFVAKLNDTSRRTLEAAAGLCLSRTNYNVEIEHWLLKLLETPNTDLAALLAPLRDRPLAADPRPDPRHRPASRPATPGRRASRRTSSV